MLEAQSAEAPSTYIVHPMVTTLRPYKMYMCFLVMLCFLGIRVIHNSMIELQVSVRAY